MFKPDLLLVWPDTIDFPLFRKWLREERKRFAKVIIVFSITNWDYPSVKNFIVNEMGNDDVIFLETKQDDAGDWRDIAVNKALSVSDNEWVFFTEPDFFPTKNLWTELEDAPKSDIYAVIQDDTRVHPCCIFIKRDLLNKTSLNFAAKPPFHDHFGQIQKDLASLKTKVATINPKLYYHMNGLSHNMFLIQGGKEPVYQPQEFKDYLRECLTLDIPIHKYFRKASEDYLYAKVN